MPIIVVLEAKNKTPFASISLKEKVTAYKCDQ